MAFEISDLEVSRLVTDDCINQTRSWDSSQRKEQFFERVVEIWDTWKFSHLSELDRNV